MVRPQMTEFMRRMRRKSVAIIPAARESVRSNDTNYRYRQDSDFYYLTGFEEPEAIAVINPEGEQTRQEKNFFHPGARIQLALRANIEYRHRYRGGEEDGEVD